MQDGNFGTGNEVFLTQELLQTIVANKVKLYGMSHMDALIKYCEDNMVDIEEIADVVCPALADEIRQEAISAGMMKAGPSLI